MSRLLIFFTTLLFLNQVKAQNITDTTTVAHSPRKATIMSLCLPGLGQVYNRKYWKVPVIYAGLGGAAYAFTWNRSYYVKYRSALQYRTDNNPMTTDIYVGKYSDANLLDIKNMYRKNMELSVIVFSAVYLLNIVDAAVDAHLFDFQISDDLSLNWSPSIAPFSSSAGISLQLKW